MSIIWDKLHHQEKGRPQDNTSETGENVISTEDRRILEPQVVQEASFSEVLEQILEGVDTPLSEASVGEVSINDTDEARGVESRAG